VASHALIGSSTTVFMLAGTTGNLNVRSPSCAEASHSERLSTRHLRGSKRTLS